MKAVGVVKALPTEDLLAWLDRDIPEPLPGPDDLLVKVKIIFVNRGAFP